MSDLTPVELNVRFYWVGAESCRTTYGHFQPPGGFAPTPVAKRASRLPKAITAEGGR